MKLKNLQVDRNRKIFIVAVIKATELVAFITRKNWDHGSIFSQETPKRGLLASGYNENFSVSIHFFVRPKKGSSTNSVGESNLTPN